MLFLLAEDLYFLFVDAQSKVSFAFILEIHLFLTSSFVGQASLGRSVHTLWFLRCQISIADLAIRILYNQLSPGLGFPFRVLNFVRVHLVMLPTLLIIGQVPGFLCSHISFANCHIFFCPITSQARNICSRLSVALCLQCLQTDLCSQLGMFSQCSPTLCALWRAFQRKALNVFGKSSSCIDFHIFSSGGRKPKASSATYHVMSSAMSKPLYILYLRVLCSQIPS